MGRAIAALIGRELVSVFGHSSDGEASVFEEKAQRGLAGRDAALTRRERELGEAEQRMLRWSEHLRGREHELEVREWRVEAATRLASARPGPRQDRPQRTLPLRVGPQAQALPRPIAPIRARSQIMSC